jgi:heme/copper-type cytochrome/quinol oxidase subunit 2
MRRSLLKIGLAAALFIFASTPGAIGASHVPGTSCTKVGAKALSGKAPVKCVKIAKKLLWQLVKKTKSLPMPTPKPTPQPTTTLTPAIQDISVIAAQWTWQFKYLKAGTALLLSDSSAQPPILYIPLEEPVRFTLNSNDVSHGFWIPGLMIDIKVSPGGGDSVTFTASKIGTYPGRCNFVCGREHTSMIFTAKVVTSTEYAAYLSTLKVG